MPAQTPVNFVLAGGTAMFSAECEKLISKAFGEGAKFGSFDDVDAEVKKAKQKCAAWRKLSPEERTAHPELKPNQDEWALAHGFPQQLGYKPKRCTQNDPAGAAEGAPGGSGSEANVDGRTSAGGQPPGASAPGALADREAEHPQLAARDADRAASDKALAPEASARPKPDDSIGEADRAGGVAAAGGSKSKDPTKIVIDGKTAAECLDNLRKADLEDNKRKFQKAKDPRERGMRDKDDAAFKELAKENKEIIMVRDSNPKAVDFMPNADGQKPPPSSALAAAGCNGFAPKPADVKCKTLKQGDNVGLASCKPENYPSQEAYEKDRAKMEKKGFKVLDDHDGVVLNENGEAMYSDYDLHGTYDQNGNSTWYDGREKDLSPDVADDETRLVRHGPHDAWDDRLYPSTGGKNAGPQPPVTAYTPDGEAVALSNVSDMKAFYAQNCIAWPYSNDYK
jgi:hypothetical protein